jgi:hypothetical protein
MSSVTGAVIYFSKVNMPHVQNKSVYWAEMRNGKKWKIDKSVVPDWATEPSSVQPSSFSFSRWSPFFGWGRTCPPLCWNLIFIKVSVIYALCIPWCKQYEKKEEKNIIYRNCYYDWRRNANQVSLTCCRFLVFLFYSSFGTRGSGLFSYFPVDKHCKIWEDRERTTWKLVRKATGGEINKTDNNPQKSHIIVLFWL